MQASALRSLFGPIKSLGTGKRIFRPLAPDLRQIFDVPPKIGTTPNVRW